MAVNSVEFRFYT